MNTAILPSTLLLTLLLSVGLFFFIRASVKDRTQEVKLVSEQAEESLLAQLQQYLQARSYKVAKVNAEQNSVTFEGFVRPSVFLAIFLTLLAAAGILCLALVWSLLFPGLSGIFLWLVLLSPAAGIFYWQRAARTEQVSLKLEASIPDVSIPDRDSSRTAPTPVDTIPHSRQRGLFDPQENLYNEKQKLQSQITVIAHRDELLELQRALQLKPCE